MHHHQSRLRSCTVVQYSVQLNVPGGTKNLSVAAKLLERKGWIQATSCCPLHFTLIVTWPGMRGMSRGCISGLKLRLGCVLCEQAEKAAKREGISMENASIMHVDLSSLESVRQFVTNFKATGMSLDVLVANAALYLPLSKEPEYTADGYEISVATNHLVSKLCDISPCGFLQIPELCVQTEQSLPCKPISQATKSPG